MTADSSGICGRSPVRCADDWPYLGVCRRCPCRLWHLTGTLRRQSAIVVGHLHSKPSRFSNYLTPASAQMQLAAISRFSHALHPTLVETAPISRLSLASPCRCPAVLKTPRRHQNLITVLSINEHGYSKGSTTMLPTTARSRPSTRVRHRQETLFVRVAGVYRQNGPGWSARRRPRCLRKRRA